MPDMTLEQMKDIRFINMAAMARTHRGSATDLSRMNFRTVVDANNSVPNERIR